MRFLRSLFPVFCLAVHSSAPALAATQAWRSTLYPEDWAPGRADAAGRFLHDFSYAGYGRGEQTIPDVAGPVIDVTAAPYGADASGATDATAAIQAALDAAAARGGAVVFLPAGTYRVAPPPGATAALRIEGDGVVLRGAGATRTFLVNTATAMRDKRVIEVKARDAVWFFQADQPATTRALAADALAPTRRLALADAGFFRIGDAVAVRIDPTARWVAELGMADRWKPEELGKSKRNWLTHLLVRRVTATGEGFVEIDAPTRLPLRVEDGARIQKVFGKLIRGAGVEDLSIGMRAHAGEGWGEEDHAREGTGAYDAHQSYAVAFTSAEDCWLRRVYSHAPEGNDPKIHLLSNGVLLGRGRQVTVEGCDLRFPQYRGGGGNGYLYAIHGSDNLVRDSAAEGGRHNFTFSHTTATGNVVLNCRAKDGYLLSDFHMYLSAANLIDGLICDGDAIEAVFRPWGGTPMHGVTTTQSVFWNTRGLRYPASPFVFDGKPAERARAIVVSRQFGYGYVIGTSGPAHTVASDDYVEGAGRGEGLEPRSLYLDQLARRRGGAAR